MASLNFGLPKKAAQNQHKPPIIESRSTKRGWDFGMRPLGRRSGMPFANITGDFIEWKYPWLEARVRLRALHHYFIDLIGLGGIQPYAALRVIRQFSLLQRHTFMVPYGSIRGRI
ncbi:hypothetical protein HAX54_036201 [Datura stramonium]|uniref:Uncharacterized protein n=1 Tax=Datura stramonium TaxID=4076 RepID=A0ABS8VHQ6_DATST|nr:hypothetical protein [Datura stramonium]